MCRKSFTFATFVRHLLTNKPARIYSSLMDSLNSKLRLVKVFLHIYLFSNTFPR
jgi:hypothetical protein